MLQLSLPTLVPTSKQHQIGKMHVSGLEENSKIRVEHTHLTPKNQMIVGIVGEMRNQRCSTTFPKRNPKLFSTTELQM